MTTLALAALWLLFSQAPPSDSIVAQQAADCPGHSKHPPSSDTHAAHSPYADQGPSEVKGLSADEVRAYRDGTGHGLAKPAELNHYPGPRHVLDLSADLTLTAAQTARAREIFDRMHTDAVSLGDRILSAEKTLDRAFASGAIDGAELRAQVASIAWLQGELRRVHLQAHVETRALLRPEQIDHYDALRGYAPPSTHSHSHSHDQ